jgi:hypothetical protein
VLPVFLQPDDDAETNLDSSEFKTVWRVLDALRSHDNALAEELDELRRGLGARRSRTKLPPKIVVDLPKAVTPDFADALWQALAESTTRSWEYWFGMMIAYKEEHRDTLVPVETPEFPGLGSWVNRQRTHKLGGTLHAAWAL